METKIRFILCGMLILATLIGSVHAATFPDVDENEEYAQAVNYVSSIGLMVGYGDGTFQPDKTVSRAEMATVLCKMMGEDQNLKQDGTVFSDVPTAHWGNSYVVKAASLGYLAGYGNGKFGPDDTVTYEQALTMIINALGYNDVAGEYGGYPYGYITAAYALGYTRGFVAEKGDLMTRWQIATIMSNTQKGG